MKNQIQKNEIQWWAYLHKNGTVQLKRYLIETQIHEVLMSDFVMDVFGPFYAETRNIASVIASEHFDKMLYEFDAYDIQDEEI
jgi:hypothetical protein